MDAYTQAFVSACTVCAQASHLTLASFILCLSLCLDAQKVQLSCKDFPLKTNSKKLSPYCVGLFAKERNITLSAVRLKLPRAMHFHPMFHIFQLKLISVNPLCPPSAQLFGTSPPPLWATGCALLWLPLYPGPLPPTRLPLVQSRKA